MSKKRVLIITISVVILIAVIAGLAFWLIKEDEKKINSSVENYFLNLNDENYEQAYNMLSKKAKNNIEKEDYIKRNKNIYEGIDAVNIKTEIKSTEKNNEKVKILYNQNMGASTGNINFDNEINLVKEEGEYKIEWSSKLIFPELENNYKVRVETIESKRGEILDKNGNQIALNGVIINVGIVPGKLGANKEENINKVAQLTKVSVDYINTQISASYVKEDTFVPIKKISANNSELKSKLLEIPGVMLKNENARVYQYGEETAHLVGYIQPINEEELKANEGKGYSSSSIIGKTGLEQVCEETLRGIDGKEIYIIDEKENKVKQIGIQKQKDGKDVKLTIDMNIQTQLYNQMKEDKGLFVAMNPQTGEILAAVSTPSYDSNEFILGLTTDKWNELNNSEAKPLYNRFIQNYCPGSTFKPITAAIGLTTGKLTTNTTFEYSGLSWRKDSSWGENYITTLTPYNGAKNIQNALIHSDNIFFAQAAMQIGSETFCSSLDKIGFNENIEFPLTLKKSQYSNSDKISNEKKLADSGYGQGDVLVNPIHMASIYSAFANEGNMVKPYIICSENQNVQYLKENVFTKEVANEIKNDLIQVVENPEGTANDMKVQGHTIAGKTGTAELKQSKDDNESGTLGWFNCFTTDNLNNQNILIIGMVENTQDNNAGGSHYLIKKIKTLFN